MADSVDEVGRLVRQARAANKKIVFTNGCFDFLHPGHVFCLEEARKLGDVLIVGLNSDSSVARLKGPERPLFPEEDRAALLSALRAVDAVVVFHEDTPVNVLRELEPDVYVKGGDYRAEDLVEAKAARLTGARTVIVPFKPGYSTTALIERLQQWHDEG
jgi:rfaE bifunctional protein nucleotidyltransferase chain/domain